MNVLEGTYKDFILVTTPAIGTEEQYGKPYVG
jgi:hypothetical protein